MSEMLKLVTKAIKAKAWSIDLALRDEECADLARAAIEPMVEPTQEMEDAADEQMAERPWRVYWKAMIGAVLGAPAPHPDDGKYSDFRGCD